MWNGKQRQSGVKRARCASVRLPGSAGGGLWLRRLLTIPPGGAALDSAWCGPHCAGGGEETRRGCAAQRGREAAEARGGGAGEAAAGRGRGRAAARRTSAPPVAHRSQLSPTAAVGCARRCNHFGWAIHRRRRRSRGTSSGRRKRRRSAQFGWPRRLRLSLQAFLPNPVTSHSNCHVLAWQWRRRMRKRFGHFAVEFCSVARRQPGFVLISHTRIGR